MMLTDEEIRELAELGAAHGVEVSLFLGPRGAWDPGGQSAAIGRVRIEPGDWIVGDDDGVVRVSAAFAEDVLAEAESKAATESEIRTAVRAGVLPLEAYERYGTF